ncbi:sodium:solute symporter family protein [Halorhabdus sp. CBA1104]|uniref:sodium:solute symporter family protein n=1 Tax=unclassified Halorhabdus TaxID=2621901 RepID=UPI0012B395B9|nr:MULTISPECIES: sodium:solute symporter [unclassified Halorhabdus]QGN07644.1 sodium:solute symporter family protein [Halorhabdus sp. CBA1104]
MANVAVQVGIVVGYLLVALAVGLVAYRLTERSAEDYYLAGRTIGTVVLLFTTFATLLSAFTFFGGPNLAFGAGPEWILVMGLMDGVIFGILWYVMGYKQWLIGRAHGYVTVGEMLGDRFNSRNLRGLIAAISLFWLLQYVMLQQVGAGRALESLTDGAIPYWAGATLITVFMIGYVVLAGMRGVAWTDTLQGLFMLGLVWIALGWVVLSAGGPSELTAAMGEAKPAFLALGGGLYSPQYMLSMAIAIAFGVAMFPQINQRFFVARSQRVLKRTLALWPVLVILLFVPAFILGAWAAGLGIAPNAEGNILPPLLNAYTPTWFAALVVAGAMAAMMSSSDSMLLSGSSYLTRDLYRPFVDPDASDRREDFVARLAVVAFALIALVMSLGTDLTLIEIGATAFKGYAQLTLPVLVALYWRGTTRAGMLAGIGLSQAFYLLATFTDVVPATYLGWQAGLVGMGLGLVLTVGVSLVTTASQDADRSLFEGLNAD